MLMHLRRLLPLSLAISLAACGSGQLQGNVTSSAGQSSSSSSVPTGIVTSEVDYRGNGIPGYLARPEGDGSFPGLILIHEFWGLNDNIRDFADRFAAEGYAALAVDLYDGKVAATREEASAMAGEVRANMDPAFDNLRDAVAWLEEQNFIDGELAAVGWCFGGGWAYQMAANNLDVDASVIYYGQVDPDHDFADMRAHILGHFGEEDRSITVDTVNEFRANLETANGEHEVYLYPNAGHGFANEDNSDAYNEEPAELAWQRTIEFLRQRFDE